MTSLSKGEGDKEFMTTECVRGKGVKTDSKLRDIINGRTLMKY